MIETLITSTVLISVIIILRTVLKSRINSRIRYSLWLIAAVRLMLPFGLMPSGISIINTFDTVISVSDTDTEKKEHTAAYDIQEHIGKEIYYEETELISQETAAVQYPQKAVTDNKKADVSIENILETIWLTVAVGMLIWFLCVNIIFDRRLKCMRTPFEYDAPIKMYTVKELSSPCIFGLLSPSVYIPERYSDDEESVGYIAAHELCHYYHGDMVWTAVRYILLSVYWFDPFVWLAAILSKQDCECACDEAAIKLLGEEKRFRYGKIIIDLIPRKQTEGFGVASTSMASGNDVLKERMRLIASAPKNRKAAVLLTVFLLMLSSAATFTSAMEYETADTVSDVNSAEDISVTVIPDENGEIPVSEIAPLVCGKKQSEYIDDRFSVTAEITGLSSSLYYPEIVGQLGEQPQLFVMEARVRVKNISHKSISFDCKQLSLISDMKLYPFGNTAAVDIPSGNTVSFELYYTCTLSQAGGVSGFEYSGAAFEAAEELLSDKLTDIIEIQSAEDVRDYYYREFVVHRYKDHHVLRSSTPVEFEAYVMGRTGSDGEYIAVKYMAYNRSDYAMIIEPSAFGFAYTDKADETEPRNMTEGRAVGIIADEGLIYEPKVSDIDMDSGEELLEIPPFICMNPTGETAFTILYRADDHIEKYMLFCREEHKEQPYYAFCDGALMITGRL
ncbi:MAG: hypothetical protein IJ446_09720 [Oscillospiraceae bacterium]|nr:hypothetical protein [Oscillospiraceae bacterium]